MITNLPSSSELAFFEVERHAETRTATVWLNRPEKKNLLDWRFWTQFPALVEELDTDEAVRAVVVAGKGGHLSAGLDFKAFFEHFGPHFQDKTALGRKKLLAQVKFMQSGFDGIANGDTPWIAAVDGACIGAGLDLIAACDIRLASESAFVSLRETKVGIVADLGSLQRLPHIIGEGNTRLLAFTGRDFSAVQGQQMGLFNDILPDAPAVLAAAQQLAAEIAANSRDVVAGTKRMLNYGRGRTVQEGLDAVAVWNAAFLDHPDLHEAVAAFFEKRTPKFQ